MYWLFNNVLCISKKSLKPTIVVVNPDSRNAGCRLRWFWFIQHKNISSKHRVQSILFDDNFSNIKLIELFERVIFRFSKLKNLYLKLRLRLRLMLVASADLAVFGKPYGPHHMEAMKTARRYNTKILSDFCDFHLWSNNAFHEAAGYSDVITAPTAALASRIYAETYKYPIIIPDKVDYCVLPGNAVQNMLGKSLQPESILWFGLAFANNEPTYSFRDFCRIVSGSEDLIVDHNLSVEIISESSDLAKDYLITYLKANSLIEVQSCQWSPDSMRQALSRPGFVILPYPEPVESCEKSANRIELALCMGKVVISNGFKLSCLDRALASWVKPMLCKVLNASDLDFDYSRQSEQANKTWCFLDEKRAVINSLWKQAIQSVLA